MTRFDHEIFFWTVQKTTGYHQGPVAPPTADGASLNKEPQLRPTFVTVC